MSTSARIGAATVVRPGCFRERWAGRSSSRGKNDLRRRKMPTWATFIELAFAGSPLRKNTKSPGFSVLCDSTGNMSAQVICGPASRGAVTPHAKNALATSPEQSIPSVERPPHKYGVPSYLRFLQKARHRRPCFLRDHIDVTALHKASRAVGQRHFQPAGDCASTNTEARCAAAAQSEDWPASRRDCGTSWPGATTPQPRARSQRRARLGRRRRRRSWSFATAQAGTKARSLDTPPSFPPRRG